MPIEVSSLYATLALQDNLTPALAAARTALDAFGDRVDEVIQRVQALGSLSASLAGLGEGGGSGKPLPYGAADTMQSALDTAAGGAEGVPYYTTIAVEADLAIPIPPLVTDMQMAIDEASSAPFIGVATVDLTVLPGSIDISAVAAQLQSQLSGLGDSNGSSIGTTSALAGAVPSFDTGGLMAREGLAYLHAGERVLNPAETRDYQRGGRGGSSTIVIHSYGSYPHELVNLIERTRRDRGY
jgi:hypothetical protein